MGDLLSFCKPLTDPSVLLVSGWTLSDQLQSLFLSSGHRLWSLRHPAVQSAPAGLEAKDFARALRGSLEGTTSPDLKTALCVNLSDQSCTVRESMADDRLHVSLNKTISNLRWPSMILF